MRPLPLVVLAAARPEPLLSFYDFDPAQQHAVLPGLVDFGIDLPVECVLQGYYGFRIPALLRLGRFNLTWGDCWPHASNGSNLLVMHSLPQSLIFAEKGLYAGWLGNVALVAALLRPLLASGAAKGLFLGDEQVCGGHQTMQELGQAPRGRPLAGRAAEGGGSRGRSSEPLWAPRGSPGSRRGGGPTGGWSAGRMAGVSAVRKRPPSTPPRPRRCCLFLRGRAPSFRRAGGSLPRGSRLGQVADAFRAELPTAILYTNECGCPDEPIPSSLTYFSIDTYAAGAAEVAAVRKCYESTVFRHLNTTQAFAVPGLFGNPTKNHTAQEELLVEKVEAYAAWIAEEPRLAGLNPWHFSSRENAGYPAGKYPFGWGVVDFPRVVAALAALKRAYRPELALV